MSRIGRKPISLPQGVTVEKKAQTLTVSGPKGTLELQLHPQVNVEITADQVRVTVKDKESKQEKTVWGLTRALVQNLVDGVTKGFEKKLEVNGVGFKVAVVGTKLVLNLGFSHPVELEIPKGLSVSVDKNIITVAGANKQLVGQFAAEIRELRKPEPYKGKGIKYLDEIILRKAGKVVKAVGGGK